MQSPRLMTSCRVNVGGSLLDLSASARLLRVVVDLDQDLLGRCVLEFLDPQLALVNGDQFGAGRAIQVELGVGAGFAQVFEGEVVMLEPRFQRDLAPALRVVCHDRLHRLALSQMTRSFNDVDVKEVVNKVAQEHGLSAEASAGTREHKLQSNISDAGFLRRLAQAGGNHLRVVGKKLVIGPPPSQGKELQLDFSTGLRKLSVRVKSGGQVGAVTVHGWDAAQKREIVGRAEAPAGETGKGARGHGGSYSLAVAGHEVTAPDVSTAESMAKGRMRKLAEGFVVAQGEMIGDPSVRPGKLLGLDKVAPAVDGIYRVERARHEFNKFGYRVSFKCVRIANKKAPARTQKTEKPVEQKPIKRAPGALSGATFDDIDYEHLEQAKLTVRAKNLEGRTVNMTLEVHDGELGWVPAAQATAKISGSKASAQLALEHPELGGRLPPPGAKLLNPRWHKEARREGEVAVMAVEGAGLDGCRVKFLLEANDAGSSLWQEVAQTFAKIVQGKATAELPAKKAAGGGAGQSFLRFRAQLVRGLDPKHVRFQAELVAEDDDEAAPA